MRASRVYGRCVHVYMSVCQCIHPAGHSFVFKPMFEYFCPPVGLMSICVSVRLFVCSPICKPMCKYVPLSILLSTLLYASMNVLF